MIPYLTYPNGSSSGLGQPPTLYPPTPAQGTPQPPRPSRRVRAPLFMATVATVALVAAGGGAAVGVSAAEDTTISALPTTTDTRTVVSPSDTQTVAAIAAAVIPSVVTIEVTGASGSGLGSGVIIGEDGLILTNNHVVAGAAPATMTVEFSDGRRTPATLVGADPSTDLAVIRVTGVTGLQAATFADSDDVVVGELAVAIGSPLGLDGTVTSGVVSAVHRPVRTGPAGDTQAVIDAIQTDTAINPGNSGGPLVDADGTVIGINSAIATVGSSAPGTAKAESGNIGVGFAIPSNTAARVAAELMKNGRATHPQLGVQAGDYATADGAGAQLRSVVAGGSADRAGLRAGDVIVSLDGRTIEDVDTLVVAVRAHSAGDAVTINYLRDGQQRSTKATLSQSTQQS